MKQAEGVVPLFTPQGADAVESPHYDGSARPANAARPRRARARKSAKPPVEFPSFPNRRFHIIYADPPWDYKGQLQHTGAGGRDSGGALRHYPTVPLDQLCGLPVHQIAEDNCLLFMWSSSPHLDQAIDLGKSWGFAWATVAFVWYKQRTNPGFYTMSQCELCLAFKRGKIPTPRGSRRERQFIDGGGEAVGGPDGFVSELRGRHSAKPEEVRRRIEAMFPAQKKIELFARRHEIPNWSTWGLEATDRRKPSARNSPRIPRPMQQTA